MTMAVKMREKAFLLARGQSELNGKHSPAGLHNPSHLGSALLACLAGQMMQHDRGQYRVKLGIGKRQRLRHRIS